MALGSASPARDCGRSTRRRWRTPQAR